MTGSAVSEIRPLEAEPLASELKVTRRKGEAFPHITAAKPQEILSEDVFESLVGGKYLAAQISAISGLGKQLLPLTCRRRPAALVHFLDPFPEGVFVDEPAEAGRLIADGLEGALIAHRPEAFSRRCRDDDPVLFDQPFHLRETQGAANS